MSNKCLQVLKFSYGMNISPKWEDSPTVKNVKIANEYIQNIRLKLTSKTYCGPGSKSLDKKDDYISTGDVAHPYPLDGLTNTFIPYRKLPELNLSKNILTIKVCEECCASDQSVESTLFDLNYKGKIRFMIGAEKIPSTEFLSETTSSELAKLDETLDPTLTPAELAADLDAAVKFVDETEKVKNRAIEKGLPAKNVNDLFDALTAGDLLQYVTPNGWDLTVGKMEGASESISNLIKVTLQNFIDSYLTCNQDNTSVQFCAPCVINSEELINDPNSIIIPPVNNSESSIINMISDKIKQDMDAVSVSITSGPQEDLDVLYNDIILSQKAKAFYYNSIV